MKQSKTFHISDSYPQAWRGWLDFGKRRHSNSISTFHKLFRLHDGSNHSICRVHITKGHRQFNETDEWDVEVKRRERESTQRCRKVNFHCHSKRIDESHYSALHNGNFSVRQEKFNCIAEYSDSSSFYLQKYSSLRELSSERKSFSEMCICNGNAKHKALRPFIKMEKNFKYGKGFQFVELSLTLVGEAESWLTHFDFPSETPFRRTKKEKLKLRINSPSRVAFLQRERCELSRLRLVIVEALVLQSIESEATEFAENVRYSF